MSRGEQSAPPVRPCAICRWDVSCDRDGESFKSADWYDNGDDSRAFWLNAKIVTTALCQRHGDRHEVPRVCLERPSLYDLDAGASVVVVGQPGRWTVLDIQTSGFYINNANPINLTSVLITRSWIQVIPGGKHGAGASQVQTVTTWVSPRAIKRPNQENKS